MDNLQLAEPRALSQQITGELCQRFLAFLDAKPKTIETYTRALRQFFRYLGMNKLSQPRREDILAYRDALKLTHKPATVQNYMVAIRLFFQWTGQEQLYPNVAAHIKGAVIDAGHKKDYLTEDQAKAVLEAIGRDTLGGLRDYAVILLMLTTGLRTIEVVRADLRDLSVSGGYPVLHIQGKGRDEKTDYVKVAPPAEEAIRAYRKARGPSDPAAPLFASLSNRDRGERLTTRSVSRAIKNRLREAGFDSDRLTAHSLRHTAATLNLLNGGTLVETQQLLRHTSLNTTMIYNHQLDREKNNSEARVAKAIFG